MTAWFAVMVTSQPAVPEHAPFQPLKTLPESATAIKCMTVPALSGNWQLPRQSELAPRTRPLPFAWMSRITCAVGGVPPSEPVLPEPFEVPLPQAAIRAAAVATTDEVRGWRMEDSPAGGPAGTNRSNGRYADTPRQGGRTARRRG